MLSKFLVTVTYFFQDNEAIQQAANEITLEEKSASLTQLTTILSIALITLLALLTLNLVKNHKLNIENQKLKKQLNS